MKSIGIAYVIWFLFGLFGGHRFYLGRGGTGMMYFLTMGYFGFGWFADLFSIPKWVHEYNSSYQNSKDGQVNVNVVVAS